MCLFANNIVSLPTSFQENIMATKYVFVLGKYKDDNRTYIYKIV